MSSDSSPRYWRVFQSSANFRSRPCVASTTSFDLNLPFRGSPKFTALSGAKCWSARFGQFSTRRVPTFEGQHRPAIHDRRIRFPSATHSRPPRLDIAKG